MSLFKRAKTGTVNTGFKPKHSVNLSEKDAQRLAANLSKADSKVVSLSKEAKVSLEKAGIDNIALEAFLVVDYSYSMSGDYSNGVVQDLCDKVLAFALETDPDGQVPVIAFDGGSYNVGEVNVDNYQGFIQRELVSKRGMGSTNLTAALHDLLKIAKKLKSPGIAYIVTDGAPNDSYSAEAAICELSQYPIFIKFISLAPVAWLNQLDDLPDSKRLLDNVDAADIDPRSATPAQFYAAMVEEVEPWIQLSLKAGTITNN